MKITINLYNNDNELLATSTLCGLFDIINYYIKALEPNENWISINTDEAYYELSMGYEGNFINYAMSVCSKPCIDNTPRGFDFENAEQVYRFILFEIGASIEDDNRPRNWIEEALGTRYAWFPICVGMKGHRKVFVIDFENGHSGHYFIDFENREIQKC